MRIVKMLSILTYLQIFAIYFTAIFLFMFPNATTYKAMVVVIGMSSYFATIYYFFSYKRGRTSIIKTFVVVLIITVLYFITPIFYSTINENYNSYRWVLLGQTIPVSLIAAVNSYDSNSQQGMKAITPVIALLFLYLSFQGAFFPTTSTGGGLAGTEYDMNYQTLGYMASYAASFCLYYFIYFKDQKWIRPFNGKVMHLIMGPAFLCCFLVSIIAGGRGGFLMFFVQSAFIMFVKSLQGYRFGKIVTWGIALIIFAYIIFIFAEKINIETSGYERILNFVEGNSEGRDGLWKLAISKFWDSPIWGHGLGSIFYETGFYSHNIFTDLLVESGIMGTSLFFMIIVSTFIKGMKLCKYDITECLWLIIFLDGFVMGMFSNYYIAICPMVWSIIFIQIRYFLVAKNKRCHANSCNNINIPRRRHA